MAKGDRDCEDSEEWFDRRYDSAGTFRPNMSLVRKRTRIQIPAQFAGSINKINEYIGSFHGDFEGVRN